MDSLLFQLRIHTTSSGITSLILPPLIKPWVAQFLLTGRWPWVQTCCFISAWVLHVLPYNLSIFFTHERMSVAFTVSHMVLWLPVPEAPLLERLSKQDLSNGIEIHLLHPSMQHLLFKYNDINAKSLTACAPTWLWEFSHFLRERLCCKSVSTANASKLSSLMGLWGVTHHSEVAQVIRTKPNGVRVF